MSSELAIRVLSSELPFDGSLLLVAVELPGVNSVAQQFTVADPAVRRSRH